MEATKPIFDRVTKTWRLTRERYLLGILCDDDVRTKAYFRKEFSEFSARKARYLREMFPKGETEFDDDNVWELAEQRALADVARLRKNGGTGITGHVFRKPRRVSTGRPRVLIPGFAEELKKLPPKFSINDRARHIKRKLKLSESVAALAKRIARIK